MSAFHHRDNILGVNRKDSLVWLLQSEADRGQLAALLGNGITAEWVRWSRGLPSWQQEAGHRKEERAGEVTGGRSEKRENALLPSGNPHLRLPPPTPLVKCLWKHHHRYTEVYVTNIFDFSPSSKVAKVNKGHPLVSNYLMHFRVE